NNTIVFAGNAIRFDNITFSNGPQSVNIFGVLSSNPEDMLTVNLTDFRLENLNPLLPEQMDGRLNGELHVKDLYNEVNPSSQLPDDAFPIGGQYIVPLGATTAWHIRQHRMYVAFGISRENQKVLSHTGTYDPKGGQQELDLRA